MRASVSVAATVGRVGRAAVPAGLLSEFTGPLQGPDMRMDFDPKARLLRVISSGLDSRIRCEDAAEFPKPVKLDRSFWAELPTDLLLQAVDQVRVALGREEAQPALTGMLIEAKDRALIFAATDGRRLAERRLQADSGQGITRILVPGRSLHMLARLLRRSPALTTVEVLGPEREVRLSVPAAHVTMRLLDGKYPNYQQVIPKAPPTRVRVPVVQFVADLKAISVFARDEARQVRLSVGKDRLTAQAVTRDVGQGRIDLSVDVRGPSSGAIVNILYLVTALEAVDDLEAELLFTPDGPLTIRPAAGTKYLHVLMQVRTQGRRR
jgi:DNA polymerase III subunit beta